MKKYKKIICIVIVCFVFLNLISVLSVRANTSSLDSTNRYITVEGKRMHVNLYGELNENGTMFGDGSKETIVMLPALAVPSPNIYFKPLAEALASAYNVVIIEPLGYGLSDMAGTDRTIENINKELYEALELLEIDTCTLLVHSISGVYGLDFVYAYPQKVTGVIAIDNTVYNEDLSEEMAIEQTYMLQAAQEFDSLRNTFESIEDFRTAIEADSSKYGADLPHIIGYEYTETDQEEYCDAYAHSSNQTIQNEIQNMNQALESIKDVKFPSSLPVLTMISSDNVEAMPVWKTAHQDQLDFDSGNHQLYTVAGNHYIWYTNLDEIVQLILEWRNGK